MVIEKLIGEIIEEIIEELELMGVCDKCRENAYLDVTTDKQNKLVESITKQIAKYKLKCAEIERLSKLLGNE